MLNTTTSSYGTIGIIKAPCYQLTILGALCVLLFVLGVAVNVTLLWIIAKNRDLHTSNNFFIICLAINNLYGTLSQFPLLAVNAFSCKFLFNEAVCAFTAFSFFFSSLMVNCVLTILSVERYLVICKSYQSSYYAKAKRLTCFVTLAVLNSAFWSLTPLFGWSRYISDGVGTSCVIDPAKTLSYGVSFSVFGYLIPLLTIIYTNQAIIKTVKKSSQNFVNNAYAKRKYKKEKHLVKVTAVLICSFFATATPSVIVQVITIINTKILEATLIYITGSLLLARTSLIWPSVFYMMMNKDIKKQLFNRANQVTVISLKTQVK